MSTLAFLPNLSPFEILVILVIALLLFGKRLPEVGRSLGKGIVEFKKGIKGVEDEVNEDRPMRREERSQFTDGRERHDPVDGRRVGRADGVETPQNGGTQG